MNRLRQVQDTTKRLMGSIADRAPAGAVVDNEALADDAIDMIEDGGEDGED